MDPDQRRRSSSEDGEIAGHIEFFKPVSYWNAFELSYHRVRIAWVVRKLGGAVRDAEPLCGKRYGWRSDASGHSGARRVL